MRKELMRDEERYGADSGGERAPARKVSDNQKRRGLQLGYSLRRVRRSTPAVFALILVVGWIIYGLAGHWLIESAYQGRSIGVLNQFFESRDSTALSRYMAAADRLAIWGTVWATIGFAALWLVHRWMLRAGLRIRDATIILAISLLLTEGVLRLALSDMFSVERLRNPSLYAAPLADDDYFKLQYRWNIPNPPRVNPRVTLRQFDPLLGWRPQESAANPLGLIEQTPYAVDPNRPTILFFGDSYVAGKTKLPDKMPQILDRAIPSYRVYNYGVAGYGVGQIYLRFRQTRGEFRDPVILLGILTRDLDRSVLAFRGAPKPQFVVKHGELEMENLPLADDIDGWLRNHPVRIRSYLAAYLEQVARRQTGEMQVIHRLLASPDQYRRAEIEAVNTKILEAAVAESKRRGLRFMFVIFGKKRLAAWLPDRTI